MNLMNLMKSHINTFEEYIGCANIDNSKYKEIIIGNCAG